MTRRWTGRPKRNEFAPVSCELLVALASTKLTDRAHRVVLALLASSYGRYRSDTILNRAELSSLTGLDHSNVSRALRELEDRGLVIVEEPKSRGKRARIEIRKTYGLWEPATELDRLAESTYRCVQTGRERVEGRVQREPLERSGYRNGDGIVDNSRGADSTVSRDTFDRVEEHADRVDGHGRPRVKGVSEKPEMEERSVSTASIVRAPASGREGGEAAATDHAEPLNAEPLITDRPARRMPRPRISAEVEASVEALLLALPHRQQTNSRRNFFDLAYRGAGEADFHDARAALAACDPERNPAGFAYRCIANRLTRQGDQMPTR